MYFEEIYTKVINHYSYLNVDELYDVAIEITFDGEEYYLFMLLRKLTADGIISPS